MQHPFTKIIPNLHYIFTRSPDPNSIDYHIHYAIGAARFYAALNNRQGMAKAIQCELNALADLRSHK
jgi:hypothetical protein